MPAWIHQRARHLQEKNPDLPESQAFAIATQQAHAVGKSPKGYGTAEGRRVAKEKYDSPRSHYKKTAGLSEETLAAFLDEFAQIQKEAGWLTNKIVLPAAILGSLGGGVKAVQHIASKVPGAAAAVTAKAPGAVAKGMGGLTHAAQDVREFMP